MNHLLLRKALIPDTKIQIGRANQVLLEIKNEQDLDGLDLFLEKNQHENLYWLGGVRADKVGRANDQDILKKNYLFFDLDIRENNKHLTITDQEIQNSWLWMAPALEEHDVYKKWTDVVFSGNGLQVYFFGDIFTVQPEEFKATMERMIPEFGKYLMSEKEADRSCCNISRLSRLPGSINQKTGQKSFILQSHV